MALSPRQCFELVWEGEYVSMRLVSEKHEPGKEQSLFTQED